MWIPQTEREILAAIKSGSLVETATFDAKAELPAKGKSKDLATDVAAMANDGGTLLYGVGEDEHGRPTNPKPFELVGAKERLDQIVRTSISEPPAIEVHEIQTDDDSGLGYLVVAVPPLPGRPIWSRWGRRTVTTGGAPPATFVSRRGRSPDSTRGAGGGRLTEMRSSKRPSAGPR